ncbi:MAG: FAD-dependent oxidoreductase, partial [Desulfobacteraceae bacterium]|nr:FAD-dependent oxidoreductase [Desulfobacteraceae bacterium]
IPSYRLPEEVLDKEIDQVLSIGITLETDEKLGRDFDLATLNANGFEAVFVATGLQESKKIDLEGSELEDVFWGVDLLADVSEGKEIHLKERVLVVGGGNVAVDVALTALRLGAKEVTMACLESREEMPANPWEIRVALEEGVKLMPSWGPKRIIGDNGSVTGIELVRCTSVFDEGGNFCPAFDDARQVVEADQVVLAIGQTSDLSFADNVAELRVEKDLIVIHPETQGTDMAGLFAGGDAANGPGTVIEAIASGRRAAATIDKYLVGDGVIDETFAEKPDTKSYTGKREKGFADLQRAEAPTLPLSERHEGFREVELCLDDNQAIEEAQRCLQCDLEISLARAAQLQGEK